MQTFNYLCIEHGKYAATGNSTAGIWYQVPVFIKGTAMANIKTEKEYKAIMDRIDQLFFQTDETTPSDDPRLIELDMLSALIEEYEKENY